MKTTWLVGDSLYLGGHLVFRPMTASVADGLLVASWRNTPEARAAFFNPNIVTPETHACFMAHKSVLDLIWLITTHTATPRAVGMASLTLGQDLSAEYGRLWLEPDARGLGYGAEAEFTVLALAFEFYWLHRVWAEVLVSNTAAQALHDKTGWRRAGVDVPGHTHPRGPVQLVVYDRGLWTEKRAFARDALKLDLGDWTP